MTPPLIPDASVILKWILPPENEPDSAAARDLRDAFIAERITLCLPALWLYEVGNTLSRKRPMVAARALAHLTAMALPEAATKEAWVQRAAAIVAQYNVTFYDAAYHALALHQKGVFITADERYIQKTAALGHIAHLRDWQVVAPGNVDPT